MVRFKFTGKFGGGGGGGGGGGTLSQGHIKNLNKESRGQSVTSDLRPSNQSLMRPTTSHTDVLKNRADIISPINFPLLFFT